jgi:hypothetical protein
MSKKIIIISVFLIFTLFFAYKHYEIEKHLNLERENITLNFDSYILQNGYPEDKEGFLKFVNFYNNINIDKSNLLSYDFKIIKNSEVFKVYLCSPYYINNPLILDFRVDNDRICEYGFNNYIDYNEDLESFKYIQFRESLKQFLQEKYKTISLRKFEELDLKQQKNYKRILFRGEIGRFKCICSDYVNSKQVSKILNELNIDFSKELKNNENIFKFGIIIEDDNPEPR